MRSAVSRPFFLAAVLCVRKYDKSARKHGGEALTWIEDHTTAARMLLGKRIEIRALCAVSGKQESTDIQESWH